MKLAMVLSRYTRDPIFMKQMDKLVSEYPETFRCRSVSNVDRVYEVPTVSITFLKPRKLSEEQREVARERLKSNVKPIIKNVKR